MSNDRESSSVATAPVRVATVMPESYMISVATIWNLTIPRIPRSTSRVRKPSGQHLTFVPPGSVLDAEPEEGSHGKRFL